MIFFFFQAEDGIRDLIVTGVQTCALPISGVKPGAATADLIEDVLTRITLPGALFLTVVAMLPIVVSNVLNMPFGFGGTALLIVVGVALDTVQQVQQHLLLRHYDGFMKEGRVKFRGRQRYM